MPLNNHASSLARWLVRLAQDASVRAWIADHPDVFVLYYALLATHLQWDKEVRSTLLQGMGDLASQVLDDGKAFEKWRKKEAGPLGKLPMAFMERLFEGSLLHMVMRHRHQVWNDFLDSLVVQLNEVPTSVERSPLDWRQPKAQLPPPEGTSFQAHLALLRWMIAFTPAECETLELAFLLNEDPGLRLFMDEVTAHQRWSSVLPRMLGLDEEGMDALTSPRSLLAKSGLAQLDPVSSRLAPLHPFWRDWFATSHGSLAHAFQKFVKPLEKQANAAALARLQPMDQAIITALMTRPMADPGVNVLLYGSRQVDILGLVHDQFCHALGLRAYVLPKDLPSEVVGAVAYLAQRYVGLSDPDAVLVITSADRVLTRTRRGMRQFLMLMVELDERIEDAETDAVLLRENPAKTIWVGASSQNLSEDNIGRFLFSAEVRAASRSERRAEIDQVLARLPLSEGLRAELATHTHLSEQQLHSALRLVQEVTEAPEAHRWSLPGVEHGSVEYQEALVRHAIEQGQKAMARPDRERFRTSVTTYSLDYLNLRSSFSIQQILKSLQRRPRGSLCFYGIPGTGKTQLAEYLALQLDKPLIKKTASELIDKYIGESEKNLSKMFEEATEQDAILFLDEADTFLADRTMAEHRWEISQVNELLQAMERFQGIFICATNLFDTLDRAALRRFTFKVEFLDLEADQRWAMFCNEAHLVETDLPAEKVDEWKQALMLMYLLTPGDFATIQRQCEIMEERFSPEAWLQALTQETEVKRAAMARPPRHR